MSDELPTPRTASRLLRGTRTSAFGASGCYGPSEMRRRLFIGAMGLSLACPASLLAQERPGWRADGPREGREAADPGALTASERRHLPVLLIPERVRAGRGFDLVVQVGVEPHVMTADHHIDWVEVTVGEDRAFVADLGRAVRYPIVRVPLALESTTELTVRSHCNLHGAWRTVRRVEVVQ